MQEITFPLEFIISGTPVSANSSNGRRRAQWKTHVQNECQVMLPEQHICAAGRFSVTILHLPEAPMEGDVDNIVKLILDALCKFVFFDDDQIDQVFVKKLEPGRDTTFTNPTEVLASALETDRPVTFVRITDDLAEYSI